MRIYLIARSISGTNANTEVFHPKVLNKQIGFDVFEIESIYKPATILSGHYTLVKYLYAPLQAEHVACRAPRGLLESVVVIVSTRSFSSRRFYCDRQSFLAPSPYSCNNQRAALFYVHKS